MRLRNNRTGIVLFIVIVVVMIMSIFAVTIFSQSMSQSRTSLAQVDSISLEQFAKGALWAGLNKANQCAYQNPVSNCNSANLLNAAGLPFCEADGVGGCKLKYDADKIVFPAYSFNMHGHSYTATVTICNPATHYYDSSTTPHSCAPGVPTAARPNAGVYVE